MVSKCQTQLISVTHSSDDNNSYNASSNGDQWLVWCELNGTVYRAEIAPLKMSTQRRSLLLSLLADALARGRIRCLHRLELPPRLPHQALFCHTPSFCLIPSHPVPFRPTLSVLPHPKMTWTTLVFVGTRLVPPCSVALRPGRLPCHTPFRYALSRPCLLGAPVRGLIDIVLNASSKRRNIIVAHNRLAGGKSACEPGEWAGERRRGHDRRERTVWGSGKGRSATRRSHDAATCHKEGRNGSPKVMAMSRRRRGWRGGT